ncbi:hypothetical protein DMH25_46350 [Streptomyces sp. WAC 01325]|nr:hypothetical protein DMH25_46350 [Streptomyces sp. WAC 01325]
MRASEGAVLAGLDVPPRRERLCGGRRLGAAAPRPPLRPERPRPQTPDGLKSVRASRLSRCRTG